VDERGRLAVAGGALHDGQRALGGGVEQAVDPRAPQQLRPHRGGGQLRPEDERRGARSGAGVGGGHGAVVGR